MTTPYETGYSVLSSAALTRAAERAEDFARAARRRGRLSTAANHSRKAAKLRTAAALAELREGRS